MIDRSPDQWYMHLPLVSLVLNHPYFCAVITISFLMILVGGYVFFGPLGHAPAQVGAPGWFYAAGLVLVVGVVVLCSSIGLAVLVYFMEKV
jgi:hypothetical protein